jgi:hypothetical protein
MTDADDCTPDDNFTVLVDLRKAASESALNFYTRSRTAQVELNYRVPGTPRKKRTPKETAEDNRIRQLRLEFAGLSSVLNDFAAQPRVSVIDFWDRVIAEFPRERLRLWQVRMLDIFDRKAANIQTMKFCDSMVFIVDTGQGKSVLFNFAATHVMFTHMSSEVEPPKGIARPFARTLLILVPTIALAHEVHNKMSKAWNRYATVVLQDWDPEKKKLPKHLMRKLPEVRYYFNADDRAKCTPLTSPMIKIVAGGTGSPDIKINGRQDTNVVPDEEGHYGRMKQAAIVVATYEHGLNIITKADKIDPQLGGTAAVRICGVIMDEVHYMTESDRPAAAAVFLWCKIYDICVVGLSATCTVRLSDKLRKNGVSIHQFSTMRDHPRIGLDWPAYNNECDLIFGAAEVCFGAYLTAVLTRYKSRTGIFIENKLHLKIVLCVLYHYIFVTRRHLFPDGGPRAVDTPAIHHLVQYARADITIQRDTTPYATLVDETFTTPFNVVFVACATIGIVLVNGDQSTLIRKQESFVISDVHAQVACIMSTSALAEGVNMPHLRILAVLAAAGAKASILLSSVKILQMIGRQDREDRGGLVLVPPIPCHYKETREIPSTIHFADVIGGGVDAIHMPAIKDNIDVPFDEFRTEVLKPDDLAVLYPGVKHDKLVVYAKYLEPVTGFMPIPYYGAGRLMTLPGFYRITDRIVPSLSMRIMKLFRSGKNFNFTILGLPMNALSLLSCLPCFTQIGLITLFFQMKQTPPSKSPFQVARFNTFTAFVARRRQRIATRRPFLCLFTLIQSAAMMVWQSQMRFKWKLSMNEWNLFRFACSEIMCDAFAAFLTEVTMATRNWDGIASEWGIYDSAFCGFFSAADTFVSILVDGPYFPVADFESYVVRRVGEELPEDASDLKNYNAVLNDVTGRAFAACEPSPRFIIGCDVTDAPRIFSPFGHLSFDFNKVIRGRYVAENGLLLLLVYSANLLIDAFNLDREKDTFSTAREFLGDSSTARYATTLIDYSGFVDEEMERIRKTRLLNMQNRLKKERMDAVPEGGAPPDVSDIDALTESSISMQDVYVLKVPFAVDMWKRIPVFPFGLDCDVSEYDNMCGSDNA